MSPAYSKSQIALAMLGTALAVTGVAYASLAKHALLLIGSFGATTLLLFMLPDTPYAQPRAVVGGHALASLVAYACLTGIGHGWWVVGVATALGVGAMMATRTVHPPAGSNALIIFAAKPTAVALGVATLTGTVGLVLLAWLYHRATGRGAYPRYWLRPPAADQRAP